MYKKSYKGLTTKDREGIESELLKSALSYHDIAAKFNVFDDVITRVAVDMGLIPKEEVQPIKRGGYKFKSDLGITTTPAPSTPSLIVTPEPKKTTVKKGSKKMKKRTAITEALETAVLADIEAFRKNNWKYFNRESVEKKFDISSSSLSRILERNNLTIPKKGRNGKLFYDGTVILSSNSDNPIIVKEQVKVKESVSNDAEDFTIDPITSSDLISLSQYVDTKVISTKIDNTLIINKITGYIFSKDVAKIKMSDDIETPIRTFFEENIKDKKINLLKVYFKPTDIDFRIASTITKYAAEYQCNLTFYKGSSEISLVSDYEKLNKNFQKISSAPLGTNKFLYKTEYDTVADLDTIYTVNIQVGSVKQLIVMDSYDKALNLVTRYEKKYEADHTSHTIKVTKINNGNEFTFFTLSN